MDQLKQFDKAFIEYFSPIHPKCTLTGIHKLVKDDLLIEIECQLEKE